MSYSEKRLKMCVVYFTIFKIRKYVKYYSRVPAIENSEFGQIYQN